MSSVNESNNAQKPETHLFNAEVTKLLSIFINSMYTDKNVYLRELLSNCSDASDKLRYDLLSSGDNFNNIQNLKIEILPDKEAKTLTIRDYGIGMTKNELINNLGTIAKSGTMKYLREARESGEAANLIGQFGVGFYSSFLVASHVEVVSKSAQDEQYRWESNADGSYTIVEDFSEPLLTGTKIILHMKDDAVSFLEERTIRDTFKKHSNFLAYPIYLWVEKSREVEVEDEEEAPTAPKEIESGENAEEEGAVVEVEESSSRDKGKKKKVKQVYHEFELLNKVKPVWHKMPSEVSEVEYAELYKHISGDWEEHLAVKHLAVEGSMNFSAIIFIPKRPPFDLFEKKKKTSGPVKLYVNKVFITDDNSDMLPEYLFFVQGIVDCDELPLNVSRHQLQESKLFKMIRKTLVAKIMELLDQIKADETKYPSFYKSFSRSLKLGVHEDATNRKKLAGFLMFNSSLTGPESQISFEDYIKRMKDNQKDIYIITAENYITAHGSPFVEAAKKRGIEVLYMVEPIDEYLIGQLKEYDGKKLVCLTKEGVEFPIEEDEKKEREEKEKKFESFCKYISEVLSGKVEKVTISWRMVQSPFCVVTSEYGWSANMERIMKAQALKDTNQLGYMAGKKFLEVNIDHPVVQRMHQMNEEEPGSVSVRDVIHLLYATSLISAGFPLEDPQIYASRISRMVELGIGLQCSSELPDSTISVPIEIKNSDDELESSDDDMERMEEVD